MQFLSSSSAGLLAPGATPEIDRLVLRWRSSSRGDGLPFYEDVALGSLGLLADHLALARLEPPGAVRLLRAGAGFEGEVGRDLSNTSLDELASNYRLPLADCLRRATASGQPASGLARCLVEGSMATCDLLALPLHSRWGGDLVLCYMRRRPVMHELLDAIYRSTGDGLLALAAVGGGEGSPDFQVVSLNAPAAGLFGRPEEVIRWQLVSDLVPRWGEDALRDELHRVLASQRPREFEYEAVRSGGGRTWLRVSVAPLGDLLGVALTDVTEMKRREDSVRLLFAANPMPLVVYERASLRLRRVNDAAVRLCGRPADDLLAQGWPGLFAPEQRAALLAQAHDASGGDAPRPSWRIASARGFVEVEIYTNELVDDGAACVLASLHDVTEQRRAQVQVAYLAHHDELTGLCNRTLFRTRLLDGLARARDGGGILAILCIDLDFFKQVNDTLGHGAGDQVLREVGARIACAIGPADVAARLGGDEFAVIARGLSGPDAAAGLAERLIARIAAPYAIDRRQVVIGASIGLSIAPGDGSDPDILLGNADIALYRSKAEGRGCFHFFEAGMDGKLVARRSLEADLRQALVRGEFELFYQPIVDAASLAIQGFEALLRWFHPDRGAVSPADFIPIAEEIGAIDAIGAWVLRSACAEAARWPGDCRVAVNLSPAQFRRGDLPAAVSEALGAAGLDPRRLELEITESVFLTDSADHLDVLHRLRALGVAISLDDFGTGYSSLAYLNRFPFDKIKIDRSFIRDMAEDRHGLAIIRAVVSLGASLGIRTLAEGVETAEQRERLRAEGCTELQGFLLGRPMPAPRLPALLAGLPEARDAA